MGHSMQIQDAEGCYQKGGKAVEYDYLNPDLSEQANYAILISQANTLSDRYQNEDKPNLFNSPILCRIKLIHFLLLILILVSTATLSVFIHILVSDFIFICLFFFSDIFLCCFISLINLYQWIPQSNSYYKQQYFVNAKHVI